MKTFTATMMDGPKHGHAFTIAERFSTFRLEGLADGNLEYRLAVTDGEHLLYTFNGCRQLRYSFGAEMPPREREDTGRFWTDTERRRDDLLGTLPQLPEPWQWFAEERKEDDPFRRSWLIVPRFGR